MLSTKCKCEKDFKYQVLKQENERLKKQVEELTNQILINEVVKKKVLLLMDLK
jgi:phosphoribosylformylglycinamidine (FGAM) synthase PurS component